MHTKKTIPTKAVTALAFSVACFVGTPASADDGVSGAQIVKASSVVGSDGGSERINNAGKLRTLSQRIPAAACNLQAAVDPFKSSQALKDAVAEFNQIINALKNGDAARGINGVETNRKTLQAIEAVETAFAPMLQSAEALLQDASNLDAEMIMVKEAMPVLSAAKLLVSQVSGQYSNPAELVQSDAVRIDIAGRQRMLTQEISREACHILSGIEADTAKADLPRSIQMFEMSMQALRFGMPEAGIKVSDNPAINDGLTLVASNWADLRPHLAAIEAGETLDRPQRAELFHGLTTTLHNMDKVVHMYSDASKLGL